MSEFADYFSSASDNYRVFRPRYPAELFAYLAGQAPASCHAWDCGCGNGQASIALAQYFNRVTATDASDAQIRQAQSAPNITYKVSPAERMDVSDESLDLVTVAQAIHWFDHPAFFAEVDRVLKPGGVLAAWGYQLLYTDTVLDEVVETFHSQVVGPYWPKGRELLDNDYRGIAFPYPRLAPPRFFMRQQWNFQHLLGYLNTWSAVKRYQQDQGINPLEIHLQAFRKAWGDESQVREVYWPLIIYVGRKE